MLLQKTRNLALSMTHYYLSVEEVILAVARCWRRRGGHGGPEEELQAGDGAQQEVVRCQLQENQNKWAKELIYP